MVSKYRYHFLGCLAISFLFHGAIALFIQPVIEKKTTPVMVSWSDILATADLTYRPSSSKRFSRDLFISYQSREYFLPFLENERIFFPEYDRIPFTMRTQSFLKKDTRIPFEFKKSIVPLLDLFEIQCPQLIYKTEVTSKGRILFATPLVLPLNSSLPLYIEEHLKESLIFLGKDNFYWTEIKVMIK